MTRKYDIQFARSAARALLKIDPIPQRRIVRAIEALALDSRPHGVKQLAGEEKLHRIRVGDFRVIYQIRDATLLILVLTIGNRRDVYR